MALNLAYAWIRATIYLVCVCLCLEAAHRVYWKLLARADRSGIPFYCRTAVMAIIPTIPLLLCVALTSLVCNVIERRSLGSIGLTWDNTSLCYLSSGIFVAGVGVMVILAVGRATGLLQICESPVWSNIHERLPKSVACLTDFILGAPLEEIIVRGYILSTLLHASGPGMAIVGSSVIFSLLHFIKHPKMPVIFSLNAFVLGMLAGYARVATGALWLPIGLHLGWNVTMGPILGLPCSGRKYEHGVFISLVKGPNWITGGLYSPDAGILGTAGLVVATVGLLFIAPL